MEQSATNASELRAVAPASDAHKPRHLSTSTRRRLVFGLRWLIVTAVALGVVTLGIAMFLRPTVEDLKQLALAMAATGAGSLVFGELVLWALDLAHLGSVRVKLAVPPLLTAAVIALNVAMLAHLMFITVEDSRFLYAFLLFGALVALAVSSSIAGEMSRSITRIEIGARRIARGDYCYRLDEHDPGGLAEISHLARWFNEMALSVYESFEKQRAAETERSQVIAAVSHDLRTPLASVRAMIEAIDDGVVTDAATVRRYQRTIRAEVTHLSALMDDLFDLARLESHALTLHREWLDPGDLLSDALEALHERAEQAGIMLHGHVEGQPGTVLVDPRQLYRVIINLLQNALRHTPSGGQIVLRCVSRTSQDGAPFLLIQVIDSGEGIAAGDLPYIFERTYRGVASRKRDSVTDHAHGGSEAGLGLAVARGIVEMHGGSIWAVSPLGDDLRALLLTRHEKVGNEGGAPTQFTGTALSFTLPRS